MNNINIGILALQGSIIEHEQYFKLIENVKLFHVKQKEDLKDIDALVIPGGESTTIRKLINKQPGFKEELKKFINIDKKPTFGTCAGMIILANDIQGEEGFLNSIDVQVERNSFGRQINSFQDSIIFNDKVVDAVFIRAPRVANVNGNVQVLSKVTDTIVAARQDNVLITSFHPELTNDTYVAEYFINMIKGGK